MTKKHFIALAENIKRHNLQFKTQWHQNDVEPGSVFDGFEPPLPFTLAQLELLADFCGSVNPRFDRTRWLNYIRDKWVYVPKETKS
jgi:hypothetical protein